MSRRYFGTCPFIAKTCLVRAMLTCQARHCHQKLGMWVIESSNPWRCPQHHVRLLTRTQRIAKPFLYLRASLPSRRKQSAREWGTRLGTAYLSVAAAAVKTLESPGNPSSSEHRRADALQYCFGLNSDASAIWCACAPNSDSTVNACSALRESRVF